MRKFSAALLTLMLSLLACARSNSSGQPSDATRTLNFDGMERNYIVHLPAGYAGSHSLPLVLSFHGGGGNAANGKRVSNFDPLADEKGFIVAYPNGTGRLAEMGLTWNGGTCCGYAVEKHIDDVGFIRALIADLQTVVKLDTKRIYATGLSNGGIMSYRLACDASDIFTAIAPVSGTLNDPACDPKEPVSIIHFHGTADEHLPYNGGVGDKSLAGVDFASVKDSIDFWMNFDQCPAAPQTESFADIRHDTYVNCLDGSSVELYTILGGKHAWPGSRGPAWPGGDSPTESISATELIWEFFAAHPKP